MEKMQLINKKYLMKYICKIRFLYGKWGENLIIDKGKYKLYQGDCLEVMDRLIKLGVKVDCILSDTPYGTTNAEWDKIIPFDKMWERLNKLAKPTTPIILFGNEPFSSNLRLSNKKMYRYDWKWIKQRGTGHLNAKKQPMKNNEDIMIFYKKQPTYNPIMLEGKPYTDKRSGQQIGETLYNKAERQTYINKSTRYPVNTLYFDKVCVNQLHNTQKPLDLMDYLVKTYTNEGDLILDFTMGSASTIVSAIRNGRRAIGIELDEKYFEIAKNRLENIG